MQAIFDGLKGKRCFKQLHPWPLAFTSESLVGRTATDPPCRDADGLANSYEFATACFGLTAV